MKYMCIGKNDGTNIVNSRLHNTDVYNGLKTSEFFKISCKTKWLTDLRVNI